MIRQWDQLDPIWRTIKQKPRICAMLRKFGLVLIVLLLVVPAVGAQFEQEGPCGFEYIVERGDSLFAIGEKCDVTVEEIRELNPNVFSLIRPGDVLRLPSPLFEPTVTITPSTVGEVTNVTVSATKFAANTELRVGVGLPGSVALDARSVTTNESGDAVALLSVPSDVGPNTELFVTVITADNSVEVTSEPFTRVSAATETMTIGGDAPPVISIEQGGADTPAVELISLDVSRIAPPPQPYGVSDSGALFDRVNIYLVALGDDGQSGIPIGCGDSLVPVQVPVSPTVAPLTAAIDAMLDNTAADLGLATFDNPLASDAQDLLVDQIEIINATANIELTGRLSSAGVCEDERIRAQLQATALQYATVSNVAVNVNGTPLSNILP
jgi:LysM repeat protein